MNMNKLSGNPAVVKSQRGMRTKTVVKVLIVLAFLYLVGAYPMKDYVALRQVHKELNWIEDFYTANARYPRDDEFKNQFPDFKSLKEYETVGMDENSAQGYRLYYDYSGWWWWGVVGTAEYKDPFEYAGYYIVGPCDRWKTIGLRFFSGVYQTPEYNFIYSDLNAGEVYYKKVNWKSDYPEEQSIRTTLLRGLTKPRILETLQRDSKEVIITNGNDILAYDWDEGSLKLNNPEKVGEVPAACTDFSPR